MDGQSADHESLSWLTVDEEREDALLSETKRRVCRW